MHRRVTGPLNALLGVSLVALPMPAESLARTDPSVASSPRATTEHPTINFASSPRVTERACDDQPRLSSHPRPRRPRAVAEIREPTVRHLLGHDPNPRVGGPAVER